MLHGAEIHEGILYGLAEANGAFGAGVWASGRERILKALAGAGFQVQHAAPMTEAELAALPPHWLIVCGAAMEDGFSFLVVPDAGLDPELRQALMACDGVTFSNDTSRDEPERWRNCVLVMTACGIRDADAFERDRAEVPAELAPTRERLQGLAAAPLAGWVTCENDVIDGKPLNTRIFRVAYVFDWL